MSNYRSQSATIGARRSVDRSPRATPNVILALLVLAITACSDTAAPGTAPVIPVPPPPPPTESPFGRISLTTTTHGAQVDSDGYRVLIDSNVYGTIGPNGNLSIAPVDTGPHWMQLGGVDSNCWITGPTPIYLHLASRSVTNENFDVQCEVSVPRAIRVVTYIYTFARDSMFTVVLDDSVSHRMTPRGTLLFTGLADGMHQVQLRPVPPWCRFVLSFPPMAPAIRHVQVSSEGETVVQFTAGCL
jgi:hypothetical protein